MYSPQAPLSHSAAALRDELHCGLAHPGVPGVAGAVKARTPLQWRDVAIFVHRFVGDKAQLLADGRAGIGIGSVIQQEAGKSSILLQIGIGRLAKPHNQTAACVHRSRRRRFRPWRLRPRRARSASARFRSRRNRHRCATGWCLPTVCRAGRGCDPRGIQAAEDRFLRARTCASLVEDRGVDALREGPSARGAVPSLEYPATRRRARQQVPGRDASPSAHDNRFAEATRRERDDRRARQQVQPRVRTGTRDLQRSAFRTGPSRSPAPGRCAHRMQAASGFDPALQAGAIEGMLQIVRAHLRAAWR